jgi:hypothetical protein
MKKIIAYSSLLILFIFYHEVSGIILSKRSGEGITTTVPKDLLITAKTVEVKKLSSVINNERACHCPLYVSEVNSGLIYYDEPKKSNDTFSYEFFFSKYDSASESWEKPINIEKEYSKFYEINKTMNFKEIFITIDNDIYRVDFKNKTFSPQKLNINTKHIETSPMLSTDGNTLYFVSDRKGGYGGKDIWASEKLSNNKWSEPYNLGKEINTAENEESPFLMSDGVTLYFSSKGHNGYGGYDIFVTTQNDDGLWSVPENLGDSVNSTSDDDYYKVDLNGKTAYYASDKLDKYNKDIFKVNYNSLNK